MDTAIMNTLQQVSGAIGTAVGISILSSGARSFMKNVADPANPVNQLLAFTNGVQHAFILRGHHDRRWLGHRFLY